MDSLSKFDLQQMFQRKRLDAGGYLLRMLQGGMVVAPGVYNAMGAKIAKQLGFQAVYGSGWAISAMNWALPDMGFHDRTMMTMMGKYIVSNAHPLPVIMDAETGFGTETTLPLTVQAYHEMGVAMAHLEDQDSESTRRCGNLGGKKCIPATRMIAKIKSWLVVSETLETYMKLMVRTDALTAANGGLKNAIERGKRYMDVEFKGRRPTVLWADAMMDPKLIDKWIAAMRKHDSQMMLGINYSPNKDWTGYYKEKYNRAPPTYSDLYRDGEGFRLIWHTILQSRADMEATWNTFEDMKQNGAVALWKLHERQKGHPVGDSQGMSNAKAWQAYEQFIGGEEAKKRYDKSQGYKG